jgi:DNA-binding MarR family transcriptional regulator
LKRNIDFIMEPEMNATETATTIDALIAVGAHLEDELEEALAETRLSRPSYNVLAALAAAPGETLGQRELLARVRRTAGTLSVRLSRLERAGLIERTPDPDDRRATRVQLTDGGRSLLERARPLYEQRAERLAAALPQERLAELAGAVSGWLEFFEPGDDHAPRLGIAIVPSATANRMRRAVGLPDHPGVLVMRVRPDGPAAAAGLARGDLIVGAGGQDVRTTADVDRAVRRASGRVSMSVLRGAEPRELDVRLP